MKLLWCLAVPLLAAAQTGAIEGTAVNKLTKAPVAGVRIKMTAESDSSKVYFATTDGNGIYRFAAIPAGRYAPWIEPPTGFYPPNQIEMITKGTRVEVTDGGTAKFDTEVIPASTLTGRVLGPDGPVPGVTLVATPLTGINPGMGRSDKEGRYSVRLGPGKYHLAILPPSDEWAQTFYPSALNRADALPIDIPEGVDLGGYDIRLRRIDGHKLRGVVRDPGGKPVAGARLSISAPGADTWRNARQKSDEQGAFEFDPVAAGEWRVMAKVDVQLVGWQGSTTVTMPDRDYDRVEVRVNPPFSLDATLDGVPKEHRPIRFLLAPPSGSDLFVTATGREGRARFEGLYPGRYRAGVFGTIAGQYLKSVMLGSSDVTGQLIELGSGSAGLTYTFATNGGKVQGEVDGGAGAKVTLIWADRENYIPGADLFTVNCDDHGKFTQPNLRPGNWYAIAYRGDPGDLRERIFNGGRWRDAASVRVIEGESATVKISITSF